MRTAIHHARGGDTAEVSTLSNRQFLALMLRRLQRRWRRQKRSFRLKSTRACAMIEHRKGRGAKMLTIGICGASGSGKSTLADELARRLRKPCVLSQAGLLLQGPPDMDFSQRERINYDEPQAFEHDQLRADLEARVPGGQLHAKATITNSTGAAIPTNKFTLPTWCSSRAFMYSTTRPCGTCWISRYSFRSIRIFACFGAYNATLLSAPPCGQRGPAVSGNRQTHV